MSDSTQNVTDTTYTASQIAIVVNNRTAIILNVTDSFYAALKSNPVFVDLKNNYGKVEEGDFYDPATNTFSKPVIETPVVVDTTIVE